MEEFLNKFVDFIKSIVEVIRNLVAGVRKYNDENT